MKTQVSPADEASIALAGRLLREGQVVGIPTETVYGLAASSFDGAAVGKIFAAKGRPQDNPLISHIASLDMLDGLWQAVTPEAEKLAAAFWPGPLTVILPKGARVAAAVCAGQATAAVRWPSHPVAQDIIRAAGVPLAAPSANLSGSPSPTTAADVLADMEGRVPLIVDGGPCAVGVESTVVSLAGDAPVLLRPGYITKEQLENVLGRPVALSGAVLHQLEAGAQAPSPGMKYKHYAPKAQVTLIKGEFGAYKEYVREHLQKGTFCLCFDGEEAQLPCPCVVYGAEEDEAAQARALFSALRELDARGAVNAYARCPHETGVALAVYNRLLRACAFQVVEV